MMKLSTGEGADDGAMTMRSTILTRLVRTGALLFRGVRLLRGHSLLVPKDFLFHMRHILAGDRGADSPHQPSKLVASQAPYLMFCHS